jgi:RNA polymerase sigma factor (TIGR02999 family)
MSSEGPTSDPFDPSATMPEIYGMLRGMAGRYMRTERSHTLNPTDLVHEAWLKLASGREREYADRVHFIAIAARAMRQVLVDRARSRATARRGGGRLRVTLHEGIPSGPPDEDVLVLHEALQALEAVDADAATVVVYRFFGGLTEVEVGVVMSRSERWVREQWAFARAWLKRAIREDQKGSSTG